MFNAMFGINLPLGLLLQQGRTVEQLLKQSDYGNYKGFTGFIADAVILLLVSLYYAMGNFGVGIIVAAVVVRLLMFRLTVAQIRMMRIQQYITPLQKRISERYKGDKQTQNRLMMELYQKFKLNPMASCLALFIQIPVFFGVYRALYDKIILGQSFLGMQLLFPVNLYWARTYDGRDLTGTIFGYISQHDMHFKVWQWNITYAGKLYEWALYWPALILVVLYIASTFWLQKLMRKMNEPEPEIKAVLEAHKKPRSADGRPPPPDMAEQMQKNMKFFSIFMVIIAFILSSGALLYFFIQNLLMALEYMLIPRMLKLSFSAAEMNTALEAIDKGRSLVSKPEEQPEAEQPTPAAYEEEGIPQAPLRRSSSRGFKKK